MASPTMNREVSAAHRSWLEIGLICLATTIALVFVMASWTGPDGLSLGREAMSELLASLPLVVLWFAAAAGFGGLVQQACLPRAREPIAIAGAFGVAIMLILTAFLGRLGWLQPIGGLGAWLLLAIGIGFLAVMLRRKLWKPATAPGFHGWLMLAGAPSLAVLLLASTSAPGWLWATEFGGYDVMSYHLQLPKEWLALGRITPLEHNVYSFLPSYMEGAFYHLAILRGDAIAVITAAQLLHAFIAILAAWSIARLAAHHAGETAGAAAFAIVLGTPWVIVTGSLAYNEMAVVLFLAGGLLILAEDVTSPAKAGLIGLLAAAACGSKLTAIGFVALPLGTLLLWSLPWRAWGAAATTGGVISIVALAPYLAGNALAAGNPVFPFATEFLGTGHWSEQQVETWRHGHAPPGDTTDRLREGWNQFFAFGFGVPPGDEPWTPQWSALPWLGLLGLLVLLVLPERRSIAFRLGAVLVLQLLFWLALTHIKSRFMLPAAVPLAVLCAVVIGDMYLQVAKREKLIAPARGLLALVLFIWSCIPVVLFRGERDGAPAAQVGAATMLTGKALTPAAREHVGRDALPTVYLNYLLPDERRVLFVGEAAPLYFTGNYTYYTVWDRGPLSRIIGASPNAPETWAARLREAGYTDVLINPVMLDVWQRAGWLDPHLDPVAVIDWADNHAQLSRTWPNGTRLYRIPGDSAG